MNCKGLVASLATQPWNVLQQVIIVGDAANLPRNKKAYKEVNEITPLIVVVATSERLSRRDLKFHFSIDGRNEKEKELWRGEVQRASQSAEVNKTNTNVEHQLFFGH